MDRRGFLKSFGMATGGLVATATMPEAGMLAEFMSWVRRAPAFSFPAPRPSIEPLFDEISAATLKSMRSNIVFNPLFTPTPFMNKLRAAGYLYPFNGGNKMLVPIEDHTPAYYDWGAMWPEE